MQTSPTETRTHSSNGTPSREPDDDMSVGSLIKEVADNVSRLARQEAQLLKLEIKDDATAAAKAGGMLGGAGAAAHLFLIFATLTVMFALDAIMDLAWAALIVTAVWGLTAFTLYSIGRKRMAAVNLAPSKSVEEIKEDARWLQDRTN